MPTFRQAAVSFLRGHRLDLWMEKPGYGEASSSTRHLVDIWAKTQNTSTQPELKKSRKMPFSVKSKS